MHLLFTVVTLHMKRTNLYLVTLKNNLQTIYIIYDTVQSNQKRHMRMLQAVGGEVGKVL